MKILVSGSTGFIGSALVPSLTTGGSSSNPANSIRSTETHRDRSRHNMEP